MIEPYSYEGRSTDKHSHPRAQGFKLGEMHAVETDLRLALPPVAKLAKSIDVTFPRVRFA
jgi:hypothetical protein